MENSMKRLATLVRIHKLEIIAVSAVLVLAAFLRLYHLREFTIFLGDEGRDALVVKHMIVDHKFTLLGPTASVGGFYLGPSYYYFMIPFLYIFRLDPVGPAVMVALFGIATVALLYWTMRSWVGPNAALVSAFLYASAPGVVSASRSSWNPNIMPFFSLLSIAALVNALKTKKPIWYLISGIAFGIAIQSHYLGLIIGPILVVSTVLGEPVKRLFKAAVLELLGFATGASLFLAFEIRHAFPNTRSIIEFVSRGGNTTGPRSLNPLWLFFEMLRRTYEAVLSPFDLIVKLTLVISLVTTLFSMYRIKTKSGKFPSSMLVVLVWLIVGVFGIGVYKGQLYPHYFGFLFPLPFVLIGITYKELNKQKKMRLLIISLAIVLMAFNLTQQKVWGTGSNLIDQTANVSRRIGELAEGKPFNFALLSTGNSDHAYRYFLEIMGRAPKGLEEEVTQQLIVICENPDAVCQPLGNPLWEVAGFGRAEIVSETTVDPGIRILKLIHHQDSEDLIGKPAPRGG